MIPIKLEIKGLYSYKEKQTIDFSQLTAAGLFGIFGAVGSGKSSVLEAILLAIYGNTERLASKGEKNSMVNLQSNTIAINLEFKAGKNNEQTYKASYLAKRNSKNFDDIKPATHTFYEKTAAGWLPLEANGEQLVGMKMSHFRQTVIIPQGKFREFIEQKPKDRADMMKELFGLERFDLSDRTKRLLNEEKEKKIRLETLLGGLESYSKALLQETQAEQEQLAAKKKELEETLTQKESLFRSAQALKEKAEQLQHLQQQMKQLEEQLPAFQQKRTQLSQYQTALTYLKPVLDQLKEQEVDLEKYQISVVDCERFKVSYEKSIEALEARYQKLYQDFSKKGEKEARIRDLLQIKALNKLAAEQGRLQQNLQQLKEKTKGHQEKKEAQEQQISKLEKEIGQLEVPDMELVSQLETAFLEARQNSNALAKLTDQVENYRADIAAREEEAKQVLAAMGLDNDGFDEVLEQTQAVISQLDKGRDTLLQQQGLYAYAHQLQEGEACPLCGAYEHPNPLSHNFDDQKLLDNERQIQYQKGRLEQLQQAKNQYEKLQIGLKSVLENKEEKLAEIDKLKSRNKALLLPYGEMGIADLEGMDRHLQTAKSKLQQEKAWHTRLKTLETAHKQYLAEAEKDLESFKVSEQKVHTLQTQMDTKLGEINYQDLLERYWGVGDEKIDEDIAKVRKHLEDLEINLPRAQDALNEEKQKQTTNLANLDTYEARLEEVRSKLKRLDEELGKAMKEHGFVDVGTVRQLLHSPLDPKQLEEEIKSFDRQRDITHSDIEKLQSDEAVVHFDPLTFESLQEGFQEAKVQLEETQQALSLVRNSIKEIKVKLEEKTRLTKAFQQVENREGNLKELANLFQGSGFVKYISNIYLKELVHTANHRFMKLAKNSLSLEVDENNTFWVQDHLNSGRKRLLKTLSGGQTFQASLCLALALAEKVKSLNRAEQSFFFLDEGFGALDRNALRTVFDTLKSLRHENRIVGIISHVEDLQQEIGVFAQVELDSERGSQVSYSY